MACILLFLEQRLRQDKVASIMPANIRLFSKESTFGEDMNVLVLR